MTFYLSTTDTRPVGVEPVEFLDLPPMDVSRTGLGQHGHGLGPDAVHHRREPPMSTNEPTIVLVHGAFAESASWNPVIERLQHHDTPLVAAHHRGFRDVVAFANPLRGASGDAAYLREVLRSVDGPIVLVAHSYGGMVITEAAAGNDAVVALVYVNGLAPDHGESAFQLQTMFPGGAPAEAFTASSLGDGGVDLAIRRDVYHDRFCADVPAEQAALMGATQRPATQGALSEGLATDVPAWKQIPSWFVLGDRDLIIPPAVHRFMAERAGARGIRELAGASHAISVSQPEAVAATILEAVRAATLAPVAAL
jgi:pimeloyl-ACP methyl ester carboxylesterase